MSEKPPVRIPYAERSDDGGMFCRFNQAIVPGQREVYFAPEALHAVAAILGKVPPQGFNDYPGALHVSGDDVLDALGDEEEEGDGEDGEDGEGEGGEPGGDDGPK